jgi:hypothetical protein
MKALAGWMERRKRDSHNGRLYALEQEREQALVRRGLATRLWSTGMSR